MFYIYTLVVLNQVRLQRIHGHMCVSLHHFYLLNLYASGWVCARPLLTQVSIVQMISWVLHTII